MPISAPYGIPNGDYAREHAHLLIGNKYTSKQKAMLFVFNITPGPSVDFGELERTIGEHFSGKAPLSAAEAQRLELLGARNLVLSEVLTN